MSSDDDDDNGITITVLTDAAGNLIPRGRGRPRTKPLIFSAKTSDPFRYDASRKDLFFVIRGKPITKKRPGLDPRTHIRFNGSRDEEAEFRDVVLKLFKAKGVAPTFGNQLLKILVVSCFPPSRRQSIANAGDGNNLVNFVQDSLQRHVFQDDGQFIDTRCIKKIGDAHGNNGYTSVHISLDNIE